MTPAVGPKRWLIREYNHAWPTFNHVTDTTLYITLKTDIPVHLWLLWTDQEIRVHDRMDVQRGYGFKWDPHYCFVQFNIIEQEEPGDTIYHHIQLPGWYECLTLYWLLLGTCEGIISWSSTPLFSAHYLTYIKDESMRHIDLTDKEVAGIIDHANGSITPAKLSFGVPIVLATYEDVDKEAHRVEWEGEWEFINIRFSCSSQFNDFQLFLHLNDEPDNVYSETLLYTTPTLGPTRLTYQNWPAFAMYPPIIPAGQGMHYVGELIRGALGEQGIKITYNAFYRQQAATTMVQGVQLFGYRQWIKKITLSAPFAVHFNCKAVITGLTLP